MLNSNSHSKERLFFAPHLINATSPQALLGLLGQASSGSWCCGFFNVGQQFSTSVLQEFLNHATPDYWVRCTDFLSLRSSKKRKKKKRKQTAQYPSSVNESKLYLFFLSAKNKSQQNLSNEFLCVVRWERVKMVDVGARSRGERSFSKGNAHILKPLPFISLEAISLKFLEIHQWVGFHHPISCKLGKSWFLAYKYRLLSKSPQSFTMSLIAGTERW